MSMFWVKPNWRIRPEVVSKSVSIRNVCNNCNGFPIAGFVYLVLFSQMCTMCRMPLLLYSAIETVIVYLVFCDT